jgi:hypothetical protein
VRAAAQALKPPIAARRARANPFRRSRIPAAQTPARLLSPSAITVATTISAPTTCTGAMRWPSMAQASTRAATGSTFMMGELPTTPSRGSR